MNGGAVGAQEIGDCPGRDSAGPQPEDLGWGAVEEGGLAEVGVLGGDHVVVLGGVVPDLAVGCRVEMDGADVGAGGELGREDDDEAG